MTEIRGQYLYNLQTGQTVARDINKTEDDGGEYASGARSTVHNAGIYDSGEWTVLKSFADICGELCSGLADGDTGTVADLEFFQIINLFMQGDMITSELEIGLNAKGATDISITEQGEFTVATFKYNGKDYTIQCATDAAKSQVDDVKAERTDSSIQVTNNLNKFNANFMPDGVTELGFIPSSDHIFWYMDPKFTDLYQKVDPYDGLSLYYDLEVVNPIFMDYFGVPFIGEQGNHYMNSLSEEQKKFICDNPDIFCITDNKSGCYTYDSRFITWALEKNLLPTTPEELYSANVQKFIDDCSRLNDTSQPWFMVKADAENVEFTDKTVKAIKEYLSNPSNYSDGSKVENLELSKYIKLMGFTPEDDEATIWKKINTFCQNLGSTDGKTVSLEAYYNVLCEEDILYDSFLSYDECVDEMELFMNNYQRSKNVQEACNYKNVSTNGQVSWQTTEAQYFAEMIKNEYGEMEITVNYSTISSSDVPSTFTQYSLDEIKKFDYYNEIFCQIEGTDKYILNPKFAEPYKGYNAPYQEEYALQSAQDYMKIREIVMSININNGDYVMPPTSMDDLLQMPSILGIGAGTFTYENFIYKYQDIDVPGYGMIFDVDGYTSENERAWTTISEEYCCHEYSDFAAKVTQYLGEELATGKIDIGEYLEKSAFANSFITWSNTPSLYNTPRVHCNITGSNITDGYVADYHDSFIRVGGLDIKLPIPTEEIELYTLSELKANGISRSDVELAVIYPDGTKKYRKKQSDKIYMDNLVNYIKTGNNAITSNPLEKNEAVTDPSIKVDKYDKSAVRDEFILDGFGNIIPEHTDAQSAQLKELSDYYWNNIVRTIYAKYLVQNYDTHSGTYIYSNPDLGWNDPNSPFYATRCIAWRHEEDKTAFFNEIKAACEDMINKFSDILTSVTFDGMTVTCTTIYDDYRIEPNAQQSMFPGSPFLGPRKIPVIHEIEPVIDTAISFMPKPTVIEKNIPEGVPEGINGEKVLKTYFDGICISEDWAYLYLWDSINQKYIAIDNYRPGLLESLMRGDTTELESISSNELTNEINRILISLVYGYNFTSSNNILEKDGEYYTFDNGQLYVSKNKIYSWANLAKTIEKLEFPYDTSEPQGDSKTEKSTPTPSDNETELPDIPSTSTPEKQDDYYANLDKKIAVIAAELGYEKGDDGNYYYGEGNNTYICLWNPWMEKFDKYLIASEEPEDVELEPNEDGGFDATVPTLDNLFAESCIAAKAEGFIPSDDTGVFERDNERYVYDITTHTFIKESDATKTNKKTWVQVFREAYSLAQQLGYKPSSIAFCIFEDTNGNQFKYDVDEGKFIALS